MLSRLNLLRPPTHNVHMASNYGLIRLAANSGTTSLSGRFRSIVSRSMYQQSQDMTVAAGGGQYNNVSPTDAQRSFSRFNIYKGKGAVQLSFIPPTWREVNGPRSAADCVVDREGALFMEFANINPNAPQQAGYGSRTYNWEQKIVFAMKPAELGNFLEEKLYSKGFDLYHDPEIGTVNAGATKKSFSVKPNPDSSYMFTINQTEKSGNRISVTVPISQSEMAVIMNLVSFAVPRLLGMDIGLDYTQHTLLPALPRGAIN
ncbi:hypothetical protein CEUSTIGMA_g1612.t1 [Chlamydomonas eustigma]|uniref:Uncharacterized protein n=1 Tax=Chlamydomonas eustigma TaxID=1157962 RepID=A0A250WTM0_9CHLO|nr:hypothetical protein CEUSTIGMA_g1612.t1 [Chlamydomonas eustigma]|eukprot:GAX74163.1 hypothetical protein CEUSTIGMA_g1612.t1 [Chlamydomonas eustigma]